ncbi:hypothetical protein ACFFRR_006143 [Megaselia abdita]
MVWMVMFRALAQTVLSFFESSKEYIEQRTLAHYIMYFFQDNVALFVLKTIINSTEGVFTENLTKEIVSEILLEKEPTCECLKSSLTYLIQKAQNASKEQLDEIENHAMAFLEKADLAFRLGIEIVKMACDCFIKRDFDRYFIVFYIVISIIGLGTQSGYVFFQTYFGLMGFTVLGLECILFV